MRIIHSEVSGAKAFGELVEGMDRPITWWDNFETCGDDTSFVVFTDAETDIQLGMACLTNIQNNMYLERFEVFEKNAGNGRAIVNYMSDVMARYCNIHGRSSHWTNGFWVKCDVNYSRKEYREISTELVRITNTTAKDEIGRAHV